MYEKRKHGSLERTPGVDMVGFVVRRTYTIIRAGIFIHLRRQILRGQRDLDTLGYIPWWRAYKICSHYGWLKNTDSQKFRRRYSVKKIMKAAKKAVSRISKIKLEKMKEAMQYEGMLCC